MRDFRLISADSHVFEPPDLWTGRMETKYKGRAPRLVRQEDGDFWYCEGRTLMVPAAGSNPGARLRKLEELNPGRYFDNVLRGGYDPDARIKDMDLDGIESEAVYPTVALGGFRLVQDNDLLNAIFRTYNDWITDFCDAYPKRLKGIGTINVDTIPEAGKELQRIRKNGLVGAMITVYPREDWGYDRPEYDPVWAAAQDLDMPLVMHIGSNRPGPGQEFMEVKTIKLAIAANRDHWFRVSLAYMIFSGVFARYPRLKIGSVEHEIAFVPHFLERIDYQYKSRVRGMGPGMPGSIFGTVVYPDGIIPSDIFHRNVFCSFQDDVLGLKDREIIGVDNLCWGSDYPHPESTFPKTKEVLADIFRGVPDEDTAKILGGNMARIFGVS